jgi:hypothetical protein
METNQPELAGGGAEDLLGGGDEHAGAAQPVQTWLGAPRRGQRLPQEGSDEVLSPLWLVLNQPRDQAWFTLMLREVREALSPQHISDYKAFKRRGNTNRGIGVNLPCACHTAATEQQYSVDDFCL